MTRVQQSSLQPHLDGQEPASREQLGQTVAEPEAGARPVCGGAARETASGPARS